MTHQPPQQTCELARLSLIFSCSSIVFFPILIAGIICGHLAIRELDRNRELGGRRMAKWGLIIGYSAIVVIPLLAVGVLFLFGGICGGGLLNR